MHIIRTLNLALVLASFVFAAATYGALPETIPMHIDLGGTPSNISERSLLGWFALPLINLASLALLMWLGAMLPTHPGWFNFPEKEKLLALPREYQAPAIREMRLMLDVTLFGMLMTLLMVQALLWRTAMGREPGLLAVAPFLGVLMTPVILVFVSRVNEATEREARRWAADRGSPGAGSARTDP
jgi:uncharacterized membrane protein